MAEVAALVWAAGADVIDRTGNECATAPKAPQAGEKCIRLRCRHFPKSFALAIGLFWYGIVGVKLHIGKSVNHAYAKKDA